MGRDYIGQERLTALRAGRSFVVSGAGEQSEVQSVQEARSMEAPYPDVADAAVAAEFAGHAVQTGLMGRTLVTPRDLRERQPGYVHYPHLHTSFFLKQGVDVLDVQTGGVRAMTIIASNVASGSIWIPELGLAVLPGERATINFGVQYETLSFRWVSSIAPVVFGGVAATDGCWAAVELFDEWLPPNISGATAGGGGAATATVAAQTNVGQNAASVTLLAANSARKDASIFNDTAANLFISFNGPASLTNFKVKIAAGGYWSMQPGAVFTGQITGIWDAAGGGAARVTELD